MPTSPWVLDLSSNPPNIFNENTSEDLHNAFEPPYPSIFWYVNQAQDDVVHNGSVSIEEMGAFMNAHNLSVVLIPRSVKYIGVTAFRGTRLTSVTIASDCTYFPTSFPEGCVVNFYSD
jgi:hypothetical protein